MITEGLEEMACLAELLGARTLREITANDDEVRLKLVDLQLNRFHQTLVMSAKMEVREMNDASHCGGIERVDRRPSSGLSGLET